MIQRGIKIIASFLLAAMLIWPLTKAQDFRNDFSVSKHWIKNGQIANTFTWHSNPFDIVSEDFHLYLLRAKRIWTLGWNKDVMDGEKFSNLDFRNFIQVLLNLPTALLCSNAAELAYMYILLFTCIIGIIWNSLKEKGKWPIYSFLGTFVIIFSFADQIYRIGTTLFSGPLLILLLSIQMSLILKSPNSIKPYVFQSTHYKIIFSGLIITLLLFIDIWASSFGLFLMGICTLINFKCKDFKKSILPILALLTPLLIFVLVSRNLLMADSLLRAGNNLGENDYQKIINELFNFRLNKKFLALHVIMVIFSRSRKHILLFVISFFIPVILALIWTVVFHIEITQIFHFYYFQNSVLAWIAIHAILNHEFDQKGMFHTIKWIGIVTPIMLNVTLYKPFFYKIYEQSNENKSDAIQGFASWANTQAIEQLIIQTKNKTGQKDNIATLSYEVAYALAFNSTAKILLPSGFPLHSQKSNLDLATSYMSLGHSLGIHKDSLIHYPSFEHPLEQTNWDQGIVKSEKSGFAYNLFHRFGLKKSNIIRLLKLATHKKVKVDYVVWEPCLQSLLPKEKRNSHWPNYSLIPMSDYVAFMQVEIK